MAFKYVELFAGIGGFRSALDPLGGECVFASEIDKFAQKAYRKLYAGAPELQGDITEIAAETVPDHDLLVGGFPCQAFSIAGYRKGFEDTRGTLFFDVARIASRKQPRVILLENVKGLINHDSGQTFRIMCDVLTDIGYEVKYAVLNTRDFGLPHHRERVFIVATRFDVLDDFAFPEPIILQRRLYELLDEDVSDKYFLSLTARERLFRIQERAERKKLGYKSVEATFYVNDNGQTYEQEPQIFLNLDANFFKGPDGKRTTLCFVGADGTVSLRMPTPRECWRLQGFSDAQHDAVSAAGISDSQRYKQAGNAVTVNVVQALGERLVPLLIKTEVSA